MGCDIHIYVERKNNNKWEVIKGINPWISEYKSWLDNAETEERKNYLLDRIKTMEEKESIVSEGWIYEGRNYNLFAILADVRNYYNIKPIIDPRGIPEDICKEINNEYESWSGDSHSCSYYTFKELLDFDWKNNYVENEGFVDEKTYKNFKQTGDPYPCSKGVGGGNVEKVLNCEMDRIIKNKYPWENDKSFYTIIKWKESFKEIGEQLLNNINRYIKDNNVLNLEDYRIVFWFDN